MKNKVVVTVLCTFAFLSCIHVGLRAPENFRNLIACKSEADHDRDRHIEKVMACVTAADRFIKSQETYKLDQDEQLEAFNAVYGVYFYQKDRGARGLEEIFSRFQEGHRTQDMAVNVFKSYIKERDFMRATEFAANYPQYHLSLPVKFTGSASDKKMAVYRSLDKNTLKLEEFRWPEKPSIIVVFSPLNAESLELHRFLLQNKKQLSQTIYLFPQDGNLHPEVTSWPLKNPAPLSRIVYKQTPFEKYIPDWNQTPQVYFFAKDELKYTLRGWTKDSPTLFSEGLKAID